MNGGTWIALGVAGVMLNAFALVFGGQEYTAWSIRIRNELYYFVLRRPVNRDRADRADEIADDVVRWLRPLLLVLVNLGWLALIVGELTKSG